MIRLRVAKPGDPAAKPADGAPAAPPAPLDPAEEVITQTNTHSKIPNEHFRRNTQNHL